MFRDSTIVLDTVLKRNKAERKPHKVQHKDAITDSDKDCLGEYFKDVLEDQETHKLQAFCWYIILQRTWDC